MRNKSIQQKPTISARTSENASEFARAGKAVRLIGTAFHSLLKDIKDGTQSSRLVSKFTQIIQSDPVHGRGQRMVEAGDIGLLEGFDFNVKKQLLRNLHVEPVVSIDRAAGVCSIHFPRFKPQDAISTEGNITHFQITVAAAFLDFYKERFTTYTNSSAALPMNAPVDLELPLSFPVASTLPLVVVVGMRCLQVVNGMAYELSRGGTLALQVVKVEAGSDRLDDRPAKKASKRIQQPAKKAPKAGNAPHKVANKKARKVRATKDTD